MQLKGSVGRKGINNSVDVQLVQTALNRAIRSPFRLLSVDRLAGPKTIGAIERFQKQVLRFSKPDGLIDSKGKTWMALSKYLVEPPKAKIITHAIFPEFVKNEPKKENPDESFSILPKQYQLNIAWGGRVSPAFKRKVIQIANELQIAPDFLMACMAFETGETFSPSIVNKVTGATGLIQFMPTTAKLYGTTTDKLKKMSAVDQLDYVKAYFKRFKGKVKSLEDVYMAILYPIYVGRPLTHVAFKNGSIEYKQNSGLDQNGDGIITIKEIAEIVRKKYEKGLQAGYLG